VKLLLKVCRNCALLVPAYLYLPSRKKTLCGPERYVVSWGAIEYEYRDAEYEYEYEYEYEKKKKKKKNERIKG
jgi:hypothetical protein